MPIDFGGGMIFPSSYGRDEFSAEQEREMEAGQAADEARAGVRPSVIDRVWLCPVHAEEFWVPHGGICPAVGCDRELRVYWAADEVEPLRHALQRIANAAELNLGFVAQRQIAQDALHRFSGGSAPSKDEKP